LIDLTYDFSPFLRKKVPQNGAASLERRSFNMTWCGWMKARMEIEMIVNIQGNCPKKTSFQDFRLVSQRIIMYPDDVGCL
jgi:hypothetical protein